MNILIDFTQIPVQKCGIGIYALNLISKIYELDKVNNYYIIIQDDDNALCFISHPHFNVIKVNSRIFRKLVFRFLLEQFYIPYLALKHKIDAVHSLHYSFPLLITTKRIVTIPDMTFFKHSDKHLFIKRYYFKFFICLASILADKIITISKSSKDDFLERFKSAREKINVVCLGRRKAFNNKLDASTINSVRNKYKISNNYILYLGTIEPRKNIRRLILAFDRFLNDGEDCQLVIAGKKGWHYDGIFRLIEELSLKEKVIFTGFVSEDEKPFLIGGAKIFVYPSIYEGFGIPVLEALSCGIPTITSNVSSLPEITGDAALLVNPLDVNELYSNIKGLFNDRTLYTQLKEKSVEQAKKFSWKRCAQETIEVYNSIQ